MMSTSSKTQTAPLLRVLGLLISLILLGACTPATSKPPTLTPIPKTITPTSATFTPQPTATITTTPTAILPAIAIPASPTPGTNVITAKNAGKITSLGSLGTGKASSTVWSPDNKFFAIQASSGWVVYDAKTWEQVKLFDQSEDIMLQWSPDGRLLATLIQYTDEPQAVQLYGGGTLEPIKTLKTGSSFTWSPDGKILAIVGPTKIYFYDTHSLEQIASIDGVAWSGKYRFSPDGKTFATVDTQQKIRLWDTATGKLISTFENMDQKGDVSVSVFDYSPTGESLLLTAFKDDYRFYYAYVWDIPTGKVVYSDQGSLLYRGSVDAVFNPNEQQAAFLVNDKISIVDTNSWHVLKIITLLTIENTVKIAYSADGKKLITKAGIFDIKSGAQVNEQGFPEFQLSPNGRILAGALRETHKSEGVFITKEAGILLWDVQNNQKISSVPGLYGQYSDVSFSPDEKQIASFDEYQNVQIHDISTGVMLRQFHFGSNISSIAFGSKTEASSGYILAVGEDTGRIQVWDTGNHQIINTFFSEGYTNPVAISPNGQLLAYLSRDRSVVQIADIFSGKILRNLIQTDIFTQALGFSPDWQTVVTGSINLDKLFFWDIHTGQLLKKTVGANGYDFSFFPHTNQPAWAAGNILQLWDETINKRIFSVAKEKPDYDESYLRIAFSFDGRLLAAGTSNALIDIWDVEKRILLRTLKGHQTIIAGVDPPSRLGDIKSLAFSPYNHILASSGIDCTARVWNADTGLLLRTFPGVGPVSFSPDGSILAYGGCADGKIHLVGVPQTEK